MAQISRPFQIVLVTVLAFALAMAAYLMVLRRHGSEPSTGGSSPSVASSSSSSSSIRGAAGHPAANASATAPASRSARSHTRAHTTGGAASSAVSHAQTHTAASAASRAVSHARPHAALRAPRAQRGSAVAVPSHSVSASEPTQIAAQLKQGKTVLLLFWNPQAYDDRATSAETALAARKLGHGVALHYARASQVNSFGSITHDIQIYQTPTLLIIDPKLRVTTLTGLDNAYAIEQAVAEARG